MSKPVLYLFNGKVSKFGNSVLGTYIEEPPSFDEVTIGNQVWMSKNLAIDDGQGGIYTQTVNYGQGDVTEYYYTWAAAVRVTATIQGWHLPSTAEFDALATYIGSAPGKKLKSTYGWNENRNGTDDYGFTAFPAGSLIAGSFYYLGSRACFWTTTDQSSSTYAYIRYFNTGTSMKSDYSYKTDAFSVRLIKDS